MKKTDIETVRDSIEYIKSEAKKFLSNETADVMYILEYILQVNETGVLQNLDQELTEEQIDKVVNVVKRIKKDEPLEHITQISHFYGHRFHTNRHTLIPRTETEMLVSLASGEIYEKTMNYNQRFNLNVVDVGTGTGCIVLSLAMLGKEHVQFYASDISPQALKIAKKNAEVYDMSDSIQLKEGNLLEPFDEKVKFDIIVANLPYIKKEEIEILPVSVKNYEPKLALDGGANGATLIRELLIQATDRVQSEGVILLEIQPKIADIVREFAQRFYPEASKIQVIEDGSGANRFIKIQT